MNTRKRIVKRLSSYWKMEAGCVVLIPIIMFYFSKGQLAPASYVAMIPMMLMLAIGAAYWRAKYLQLTKPEYDARPLFKTIRRMRPYALVLTIVAMGGVALAWIMPDETVGLADRVTATIAGLLALAEYVNYYHRQLQHFDNLPDFKRLLAGKGFRRSQMAVDLEATDTFGTNG